MGNLTNLEFKDGNDSTNETLHVSIEVVGNGFIVNSITEEEEEFRMVFAYEKRTSMIKYLEDILGV